MTTWRHGVWAWLQAGCTGWQAGCEAVGEVPPGTVRVR